MTQDSDEIDVMVADESHEKYVDTILQTIEDAAKVRGTGIAKRTHEYVAQKMKEGKVIIALKGDEFVGFTSAVMKMNTELGYMPVTFGDLTDDEAFWKGCQGCINHDVLERTGRRYCICTAMLFDPADPRCLMHEELFEVLHKRTEQIRTEMYEKAKEQYAKK